MEDQTVPTYGLLAVNHAYNERQITFLQWLDTLQHSVCKSLRLRLESIPK